MDSLSHVSFGKKAFFFLQWLERSREGHGRREANKGRLVLMWDQRGCIRFEKVGRFNHCFTFISPRMVISLRVAQAVCIIHRRSTEGMHHTITERLYPLCSEAKGPDPPGGQMDGHTDRHTCGDNRRRRKKKIGNWNFIHFHPSAVWYYDCEAMLAQFTGIISRIIPLSWSLIHMAWMQSQRIDQTSLRLTQASQCKEINAHSFESLLFYFIHFMCFFFFLLTPTSRMNTILADETRAR